MNANGPVRLSPLSIQAILFTGAGLISTAAHYAVFLGLIHFLSVPAVPASAAGATFGAFVNYLLNFRVTFKTSRTHRSAIPRFLTVVIAGIFLNTAIVAALIALTGLSAILCQASATGVVFLCNFVLHRNWSFVSPGGTEH